MKGLLSRARWENNEEQHIYVNVKATSLQYSIIDWTATVAASLDENKKEERDDRENIEPNLSPGEEYEWTMVSISN